MVDKALPRGARNKNPGNVRLSQDSWVGEVHPGTDPAFMQFDTMAHGVRCTAKILLGYQTKGLRTVQAIVNRWAPPVENDTNAYVAAVAKGVGVGLTDVITLDHAVLTRLCAAIFHHENGGDFVAPYDLNHGVSMALGLEPA